MLTKSEGEGEMKSCMEQKQKESQYFKASPLRQKTAIDQFRTNHTGEN